MTAPLSGQFNKLRVKGMFGGPRATKGNDGTGSLNSMNGVTYGGQGLGWFWNGYPAIIGGLTEYDPGVTMTGSNMQAVNDEPEVASESKVGGGPSQAEVPDYGGTAAY
jgi:hypothetical protein